ncbi:alpha/beta hydrolase family protein [Catenovulum sp. SX2]|uniref:alpha/beta hydrolase family protein n=1 Tax=Catenovulum sp. SX2 TaxID=3398614 RepID=UPI003F824F18
MRLSPDGNKIAYMVAIKRPNQSGTAIALHDLSNNKRSYLAFTDDKEYRFSDLVWANNQYLLVDVVYPQLRKGLLVNEYRLLKLNVINKKMTGTLSASFLNDLHYVPNVQSVILDLLPNEPDHFLIEIGGRMYNAEPSVVKISLKDGEREQYVQMPYEDIRGWLTDQQGNVRIATARNKDEYTIYQVPANNKSIKDFTKLWSYQAFSEDVITPLGFAKNPNILYVQAYHQGYLAVFKVDLSSNDKQLQLVQDANKRDLTGKMRYSNKIGDYVGKGNTYWHPQAKAFKQELDSALPNLRNRIISSSLDENRYVLYSTSDTNAGIYFLGDKTTGSLSKIANKYNELEPSLMAEKQQLSYQARDGLNIEAYLTLPLGDKQKNLPTVIFPHGGPISFDNDDFDYWTQFFANRGYAVFQMNFRGSYGYGYDFMHQGIQAWGQSMQDDVEDGTRWLIKQGIADPQKICIVGSSYGGYAALMGTVKTPDLYQCAISYAGISDIEKLVKSHKKFIGYEIAKKQIGEDRNQLWDNSPLKYVDKITTPILLIHGDKDRSVKIEQSEDMFQALQSADKQVNYLPLPDANHYLSNALDRLKAFQAMEDFLRQYL